MTYEEAAEIFEKKNYVDPDMRGRTSFDPLEKLGLVSLERNSNAMPRVKITDFGRMFLDGQIELGDMVFTSLLKTQYPYPLSNGYKDYNIKPFIGTLHLIKRVNELCVIQGINPVGISREEFGIFVLSLKSYLDIERVAHRVVAFRLTKRSLPTEEEKSGFVHDYISDYLSNFQNPHKNIKEYTDNIIRYLRLTKYIYIRGGGYYVDLEPRRMVEINAILKYDTGAAKQFTSSEEYTKYISDYNAYVLPFKTQEHLRAIADGIAKEIFELQREQGFEVGISPDTFGAVRDDLSGQIVILRELRRKWQEFKLKREYSETTKINEAITTLKNIRNQPEKPSIALEKWTNIALNIINDAVMIKPNYPVGDDNEPTFTAPRGVPDIECYYEDFVGICEVTMLMGRDQWYNEGQPVQRHLRDFESNHKDIPSYCLFVSPCTHRDTVNTFWTAVKYEYEGKRQNIIPISISQLIIVLEKIKELKQQGKTLTHKHLRNLYDRALSLNNINNSAEWLDNIAMSINQLASICS